MLEAFQAIGVTNKGVISEHLGFKSENAIYKVLSGERELSFDSLRRFAQQTGYSINWLLTGEGPLGIAENLKSRVDAGTSLAYSPAQPSPQSGEPQRAAPAVEPGGETEGVSEKNGSSRPRRETVASSPEGTESTLLLAHLELIIQQNNIMIQLLKEIAQKVSHVG